MPCKYNPLTSSHWHTIPRRWCNIMWGECQFVNDSEIHLCPLHGEYITWYEYWITAEPDKTKLVTLKIGETEYTMSVEAIQAILRTEGALNNVSGADIDCNGKGGGGQEVTDEQLIKTAFVHGYVTIYHEGRLISIGEYAMKNENTITHIDLRDCKFIGAEAFYNSTVRTFDFSQKTDRYIPVLENINAFFNADADFPSDMRIIVPASMYNAWIEEPNWVTLKKFIEKAN